MLVWHDDPDSSVEVLQNLNRVYSLLFQELSLCFLLISRLNHIQSDPRYLSGFLSVCKWHDISTLLCVLVWLYISRSRLYVRLHQLRCFIYACAATSLIAWRASMPVYRVNNCLIIQSDPYLHRRTNFHSVCILVLWDGRAPAAVSVPLYSATRLYA